MISIKESKQINIYFNSELFKAYYKTFLLINEKDWLEKNDSNSLRYLLYNIDYKNINKIIKNNKVLYNNGINRVVRVSNDLILEIDNICNFYNIDINQLTNILLSNYLKKNNIIVNNKKYEQENEYTNYPLEIIEYKLEEEIKEKIRNTIIENKAIRPRWCSDIEDLYFSLYKMRYIFKYSSGEISNCFKKNDHRSVQVWLKRLGWEFNRFEAQRLAVDKGHRDYKEILNKSKQTRIKNSYDGTSPQENYARVILNTYLPSKLLNCEVIVGLNNVSILDNGKEIDIPIIIVYKNTYYQFAVEYNGDYWHQDKVRNIEKTEMVNSKGYYLFFIAPKEHATAKQIKVYTEEMVILICDEIKKVIGYNE